MAGYVRESAEQCAQRLNISLEAAQLFHHSDVIDLHVDSFIWQRLLRYRLAARHTGGPLGTHLLGQVDIPRIRQVGINAATWVITTNPWRTSSGRAAAFGRNLELLKNTLSAENNDIHLARTLQDYHRAQALGRHAAFLGIQGGNALDRDLDALDILSEGDVVRVTLVHLSSSRIGRTSMPFSWRKAGLSDFGRDYVRRLNSMRVAVDLAHIDRTGFFQALEVHDRSLPAIVTHTGVSGVHPHWRNLDDDQLRAIADFGGVIGIMYHAPYLARGLRQGFFQSRLRSIVDHIDHVIKVVGEDYVALGSDWDGAISTPRDMPTCLELPRLVAEMLRRGYPQDRIRKVLGQNFLRVLGDLRGN